jgi:hypothetical protein
LSEPHAHAELIYLPYTPPLRNSFPRKIGVAGKIRKRQAINHANTPYAEHSLPGQARPHSLRTRTGRRFRARVNFNSFFHSYSGDANTLRRTENLHSVNLGAANRYYRTRPKHLFANLHCFVTLLADACSSLLKT